MPRAKKRRCETKCRRPVVLSEDRRDGKTVSVPGRLWQRCAEGFSGQINQRCELQHLPSGVAQCDYEDTDLIISDSESGDESRPLANKPVDRRQDWYSRYLKKINNSQTQEGETPNIDWSSCDDDGGDEDDKSLLEISDCDSVTEDSPPAPRIPREEPVHISDSSTESESPTPGTSSLAPGDRSASGWVRSVQMMLRTPPKRGSADIRTPEDSAKKRRKFLRGGLAERLSQLQRRETSAISFWRHQSAHPTTSPPAGKRGALVVEVLSVVEECTLQIAQCGSARADPEDRSSQLVVLFNKDTAVHLQPKPGDIIHVDPPWQKLVIDGQRCPVVLNTHFSRSVSTRDCTHTCVRKCKPYSLSRVFSLTDGTRLPSISQTPSTPLQQSCNTAVDSLLEGMEAQTGRAMRPVEVVVQRVYWIHSSKPNSQQLLRHRSGRNVRNVPIQQPLCRLCLLVQDAYGTFSEVRLHAVSPAQDVLQRYTEDWEGRRCALSGVQTVQRVTRDRAAWLFNLLHSLWPPVSPLRVPGDSESPEGRVSMQPPGFCYLLSAGCGEEAVNVLQDGTKAEMYQPARPQSLRDVLQKVPYRQRCTFTATVIYKRTQGDDESHWEVWLTVTDDTLLEVGGCRRTVPVHISTGCLISFEVKRALRDPAACRLLFKDAVKEHDSVLCVEHTVLHLQSQTQPLLPVQLDVLDAATPVNALCSVEGVVVGVDENTAYSWPVCNSCGSEQLEAVSLQGDHVQNFLCSACGTLVHQPAVKMQMEVFLSCPELSQCTVKVRLLEDTIYSVLGSPTVGHQGYEVEKVLGAALGPLSVYVRVVTGTPAVWMGLEEVHLPDL